MNTNATKILRTSVVIPFFNGSHSIERCLRGVAQQTVLPSQVIIVDDNSLHDERVSLERIVRKFLGLNIYLVSGEGAGQSAARNLGAEHANSDALFFLDQDDFWYPRHLERTLDALWNGADLIYSDVDRMFLILGKEFLVSRYSSIVAEQPKRTLKGLYGENFHVLPSVMAFRIEAFRSLGGFDKLLRGFEDDDIVHRAIEMGLNIRYLEVSGAIWFETPGSASVSPHMSSSRFRYLKLALERASKLPKTDEEAAKKMIFWKFLPHAVLDKSSPLEIVRVLVHSTLDFRRADRKRNTREMIFSRGLEFLVRAQALTKPVSSLYVFLRKIWLVLTSRTASQSKTY